jgi:hypothetical protein
MRRFFRESFNLEILLWIGASVAAFVAFLVFVPSVWNFSPNQSATPTVRAITTPRPTLTPLAKATTILESPRTNLNTPVPFPTPPRGAKSISFAADLRLSGWISDKETIPHFGDRSLHAGAYRGQYLQSLLYFDMSELAEGSKILFAEVELIGLNRNNLGVGGKWSLKMLPFESIPGWIGRTTEELRSARPLAEIGTALDPGNLAEGQINQFVFAPAQLTRLEESINGSGRVAFRLDGPTGTSDNLFTWDAGDRDPASPRPILRVIAIPTEFTFITNTPTPQNVLTVAAAIVQGTETAQRFGTPTPLPRRYATVNPLMVVSPQPTPANTATVQAQSAYATAVALTTGTFTPTPLYWITATPTRPFISVEQYTPVSPPTPTPKTEISRLDLIKTPIPSDIGLKGKILFVSYREGANNPQVWVMDSTGAVLGKLADDTYYRLAENQQLFAPDKLFQVDVQREKGSIVWNLVTLDVTKGLLKTIVTGAGGGGIGTYHPSWSPDGSKIAYVSEEKNVEIWVYDLRTGFSTRLTYTDKSRLDPGLEIMNKNPSWSPDGKQIVFASNRDPFPQYQLYIMNADGGGLRKLSASAFDDVAPVWVR